CIGAFSFINYTPRSSAQAGCAGGPGPVPTNIGYASVILTLGKFAGSVSPTAPDASGEAAAPEAVNIRARSRRNAGYDGSDVYNSAPGGSCNVATTGSSPNVPLIAGPSAGPGGVQDASDLRFVLLADEQGPGFAILRQLTVRFYKNVEGVPSIAPFYSTNLIGAPPLNCTLTTGYYVFSLTPSDVLALNDEIQQANDSDPGCSTNIYVGATLAVDPQISDDTLSGEILYAGKAIGSACSFSIGPSAPQTFDATGGTGVVNVGYPGSDSGCLWQASETADWITIIAGEYGSRGVTVKYTVDPNNTGGMREATLTVAGQSLSIKQSCVSITPPRSNEFGSGGGSGSISYAAQGTGCSVMATSSTPWIRNISVQTGSINYTVDPNSAASARSPDGVINVSGFNYIIKQAGPSGNCAALPIAPGQTSNPGSITAGDCKSLVDPGKVADRYTFEYPFVGAAGQHVSFSLLNASNQEILNARINLIDPNGRIVPNSSTFTSRAFNLPINGTYIVEVMQPTATDFFDYRLRMCSFTFTPDALHATYVGGTGTINVATQSNCSWDANSNGWLGITSGGSYTGTANVSYTIDPSAEFDRRVNAVIAAGKSFQITQLGIPFYYTDFDKDRETDISLFRPSNITWFVLNSTTNMTTAQQWGFASDTLVPVDYDGDGKTDHAVWRPSEGNWYIINSSLGIDFITELQWGVSTDVPVPGDYDGDGKTDIAVWRPSNGAWFIINSSTGAVTTQVWGESSDRPVPADYDGDGRVEIAVWRPSTGVWFIIKSSDGTVQVVGWGVSTDKVVPADYDGDRRADVAVWRPSNGVWFIINSSNGQARIISWGVSSDKPMVGDYDGDGVADVSVYRPNSGGNSFWFIINSFDGSVRVVQFGDLDDRPVPAAFVR
ncbi:MAG TPA: FG-GAP-like repeat-containing protein, partial [Blastocatellia bacterium]|nr:FG-GAP-like repeat-containing protein [Blastocatellia bacterium]